MRKRSTVLREILFRSRACSAYLHPNMSTLEIAWRKRERGAAATLSLSAFVTYVKIKLSRNSVLATIIAVTKQGYAHLRVGDEDHVVSHDAVVGQSRHRETAVRRKIRSLYKLHDLLQFYAGFCVFIIID